MGELKFTNEIAGLKLVIQQQIESIKRLTHELAEAKSMRLKLSDALLEQERLKVNVIKQLNEDYNKRCISNAEDEETHKVEIAAAEAEVYRQRCLLRDIHRHLLYYSANGVNDDCKCPVCHAKRLLQSEMNMPASYHLKQGVFGRTKVAMQDTKTR